MRFWVFLLLLSLGAWAEPIKFPFHQQLPNSKISLDIYVTKVVPADPKPAWCLKTTGLKPRDLMMTVLMRPGESEQAVPLDAIKMLRSFAANPKALPALGEVGDFGGRSVLETEMVGALVLPSEKLPGVPSTAACVSLVPLFQTELDVADLAGPSRIMGGLAHQVRYYPCPIWCDRDRSSVFTADDLKKMKDDPLFRSRLYQTDASFVNAEGVGILTLTPRLASEILPSLEAHADEPHRLALRVDPTADAFLIWSKGENLEAVNPHGSKGSRVSTQHICLVPGQKKNEAHLLGDGCVLFLTQDDYKRLLKAVRKRAPLTLALSGEDLSTFNLVWRH